MKNIPPDAPFIALYDLPKRKFLRAFTGGDWDVPGDTAISQGGSTLVVSGQDSWVRAFNATTGKVRWKRRLKDDADGPVSVTLNGDGSRFLHTEDEGDAQSTQIVSTRSGRVLQTLRLKLKSGLQSAFSGGRFVPRGDMVAVFQPDTQQWVFFDTRTGVMKWKMGAPSRSSEGNLNWQWSPDARFLAVTGKNRFELRDARDGRVLRAVPNAQKAWGTALGAPAFSPDGSLLYALSGNDSGFGAKNDIWQLRLRGTAAQVSADKVFMAKVRAEAERFALSPPHINQSLILAARRGDDRRVAFLLDKGASIETRDRRKETPLVIAVNGFGASGPKRYRETVQLLLKRGAEVKRDGGLLLGSAAARGYDDLIRILLKSGVSANADTKAYGTTTALQPAIEFGRISTVELLLNNGASPNTSSVLTA